MNAYYPCNLNICSNNMTIAVVMSDNMCILLTKTEPFDTVLCHNIKPIL